MKAVKPTMINEYNLNMGGVDNSDKSVYHLSVSRATKKYWKKIFTNLLDIALFDAYILYRQNTDRLMSRQDFHTSIVESLAEADEAEPGPAVPAEVEGGHKLSHLPGRKEQVCFVCANDATVQKKGRTSFWCPGCNCGIHPLCFSKLQHYWRPVQRGKKRKTPGDDSVKDFPNSEMKQSFGLCWNTFLFVHKIIFISIIILNVDKFATKCTN